MALSDGTGAEWRTAAGKTRTWLDDPQDVQAAVSREASSQAGSGALQRAQGSAMWLDQVRDFTTRVSQIMSWRARFWESKPAIMNPMNRVRALTNLAKYRP